MASKSGRYTLWEIGNSSTGNIIRTQIRITNQTRSGSPSRNITLRFRKIRTRKIIKRLLTKIAIFTDEIEKSIISYDLYSNSFLYASNICCNSSIVSRALTGSSSVSKSAETRRGFETVF